MIILQAEPSVYSPLYRGVAEGRGVILHSPLYRGVAKGRGVNSLPTCYCDIAPMGLFIPLGRGVPEGRGGILILLMSPRWVCCVCTPSEAEGYMNTSDSRLGFARRAVSGA